MFPFIINFKDTLITGEQIYIPTFFFMIMVASLSTTYYLLWLSKKKNMSQLAVLDIALYATIIGIIGARLFHVFFEFPSYYLEDPIKVFYFWQGGFVGYGAFIGVLFGTVATLKYKKLPVLEYCDLVAMACPLIIMSMRIGCVGAGCCYGKPTDFFLHFVFDHPASDAGSKFPGIPLHATQLYDFLSATLLLIGLYYYDKYKTFHGQILLIFLGVYAFNRFLIEYLRGDVDRGVYLDGLLSTSQITGIIIIVIIALIWKPLKKRFPVK
jgi:phosphatidylglycerol:prolipoprotein diacylglycerol transferase